MKCSSEIPGKNIFVHSTKICVWLNVTSNAAEHFTSDQKIKLIQEAQAGITSKISYKRNSRDNDNETARNDKTRNKLMPCAFGVQLYKI